MKEEIEGHLMSADGTFRRLNEDMRKAMIEIDKKFEQNEGRSREFESRIQHLTNQNQQKENENKVLMGRLLKMEHFLQEQNNRLIMSQKEFKEE